MKTLIYSLAFMSMLASCQNAPEGETAKTGDKQEASATATGSAPADDAALLTCIREKNFDNAAEEHVQLHQHLQQDL